MEQELFVWRSVVRMQNAFLRTFCVHVRGMEARDGKAWDTVRGTVLYLRTLLSLLSCRSIDELE